MQPYCENLKAIRYESTSLNKILADKSHRVIVAFSGFDESTCIPFVNIEVNSLRKSFSEGKLIDLQCYTCFTSKSCVNSMRWDTCVTD